MNPDFVADTQQLPIDMQVAMLMGDEDWEDIEHYETLAEGCYRFVPSTTLH